jgi:PAP2 superfamily
MQSTLALPANKSFTLNDFKQWAFPHWILWCAVLVLFAVNSAWLGLSTRISIESAWMTGNAILTVAAFVIITFRMFKPEKFDWFLHRLWSVLLYVLLSALLMRNLQVLNHLTMSTNLPMADDRLMAWDVALGFDWLAYSKMLTARPFLTQLLFFAYNQLTFSGLAALAVALILSNNRKRALEIIYLVVVTAIVCIVVAAGFPAKATMALLADQELLSRLQIGTGVLHVEQLMQLRGHDPIVMIPNDMQGLVSFPSFHTCMALIIAWCSRGYIFTALIGGLIGTAIILGTPIFGGHYLVDVLGGVAVTISALAIWRFKIEPFVAKHIANTNELSFSLPQWFNSFKLPFNSSLIFRK